MMATRKTHLNPKWPMAPWCIALIICLLMPACKDKCDVMRKRDVRQDMQTLVREISAYGKGQKPGLIIIANNGMDLVGTTNEPEVDYLNAIDGLMFESLFYAQDKSGETYVGDANAGVIASLELAMANGVQPLVIDFCKQAANVSQAFDKNRQHMFLPFVSPDNDFSRVPTYADTSLLDFNANDIDALSDARNFLHINAYEGHVTKAEVINLLKPTHYDVINMEPFLDKEIMFNATDLAQLRVKPQGGRRLLIAYMSTGEAEKYRYYWKDWWKVGKPDFVACKSTDSENDTTNFRVKYWDPKWKAILYGNTASYLKKITDAGFDGVFLDVVDAYRSFEKGK